MIDGGEPERYVSFVGWWLTQAKVAWSLERWYGLIDVKSDLGIGLVSNKEESFRDMNLMVEKRSYKIILVVDGFQQMEGTDYTDWCKAGWWKSWNQKLFSGNLDRIGDMLKNIERNNKERE